jgi:ABC-type branched-subunit amino acid transport system substrate-binding protein
MISAQNLRQLSSGNNRLDTGFPFIDTCFLFQQQENYLRHKQGPVPEKKTPVQNAPGEQKQEDKGTTASKKEEYNIGLLLPFQSQKVHLTDLKESDYFFPEETQLAVEYYQGAMLALDSLRQAGLKARLMIYDVNSDSLQTTRVLSKPELKQADLLIGPVSTSGLKIASGFALKNKIFLVSPLSASVVSPLPNPYYILANATMRSHCEKIYDFLARNPSVKEVFMLYKKKNPGDVELVNYFKQYQATKGSSIRFIELTDSSAKKYTQVKTVLSTEHKNILIIPSNDESFVRAMIRQLSPLTTDFLLEIYGMPTWYNFELLPQDQLESMNAHITQPSWFDKSNPAVIRFKDEYLKKFGVNPSSYAISGYDQMMFFGTLLMKDGKDFDHGLNKIHRQGLSGRLK